MNSVITIPMGYIEAAKPLMEFLEKTDFISSALVTKSGVKIMLEIPQHTKTGSE